MRSNDMQWFRHPIVKEMFEKNRHLYEAIKEQSYPIERLIDRPNKEPTDVIKILEFGILGDQWKVIELLNKHHPFWRKTF